MDLKLHVELTLEYFFGYKYEFQLSENSCVCCMDSCRDVSEISKEYSNYLWLKIFFKNRIITGGDI